MYIMCVACCSWLKHGSTSRQNNPDLLIASLQANVV